MAMGPILQLAQGEAELEEGRYAMAISRARKVLIRDPNHLGGLELLARAHWRAGEFDWCLDALRHLIRLNPYEPGYYYLRASSLQATGRYGEAVREYGRCLSSDNESLRAPANAAIRDLERWQESVIAGMLASDQVFQAEYALDPMAACGNRGFAFSAENSRTSTQIAASRDVPELLWDRPS